MKVLDVDLLQDGLNRNIAMLDRLESEIKAIHRAVEGLAAMDEELKGEGGNAIRAFYSECHMPLLQHILVSAASYKQVLQQMQGALDALEPDTSGHIVEQFLVGEVELGLTTIAQLTAKLTNESNSIMDQVSDIVALPHLDDSGVQEGVLDAKRKRNDTVNRLQEFDATQTAALLPFEQDMHAMETWIHNIEDMFNNNLTDIHFQTDRWAELASCSPPLTITTPTNEAEMCLREKGEEKSVVDTGLEVVDGILTGLFDVGKDFVTGIVDIFQDPKATLEATVEAVTNPVETFNTIKSAISASYERDMVNGDANSRAHWVTYALGTVATSIVGTKGVGALTKSGVAATKAAVPRLAAATNNASASLANLLPYAPRKHFAIAGEVPYNVVNANGLKDQIISMARVESGVKGTGKLSGPVEVKAPPGATDEQIAQVKAYVDGSNKALEVGALSPTGRVSTKGKLRQEASRAARIEGKRAADNGDIYKGHVGHVPDTTWIGKPDPHSWLDLDPKVNMSIGGQANKYPIGYKPTEFKFVKEDLNDD